MYLVVGLGNPGKKYSNTKHNVGFDTIDILSERLGIKVNKIKHQSVYGEANINGKKVLLIKPQTYMNDSGITVRGFSDFYKLPIENIIIIYDDIDIPIGNLRIRKKGSAGSHNGMKSVIYHLKEDKFPRIRIGIGKPGYDKDLISHVLGGFNKEDRELIDEAILNAAKAVEEIMNSDIERSMNMYNS